MADNKDLKENNDLLRQQIDLLKQRQGITEDALDDSRDFANIIADQTKQIGFQVSEKRQLRSISNSINKISQEAFSILKDELGTSKNLNAISKSRASLKQNLIGLDSLNGKIILENKEIQGEINSNIEKQILSTNKLLKELDNIEETSSKISQNFGVKAFSGISDIAKSIPGLRKFSEPFQKASGAASDMARGIEAAAKSGGKGLTKEKIKQLGLEGKLGNLAGTAAANKLKGMSGFSKGMLSVKAGFKALGPMITKALGPIGLIIELVQGIMQADKEITELQRSMALSGNEAIAFRMEMMMAAGASGDINITSSKLLKTFSALNKQFGFITNFASNTLVTMTKLTDVVGISSDATGNLAAASAVTGTSFKSNYKDVLGTSYELQRQAGVQFDLREILEETGKVTGTVRANLGSNPVQIAKAITQAKLFGASLQQVANAGKSLLDFESSINSELQAELLLGRNINLEKARLAALNGDQVTLAKELKREAGDYEDFMNMNVLQQEALAKAMGMQSDELSDILFKQDIQGKTAKELRALGKDELAQRLESQTAADQFNATMDKMKNLFADLGTALTPVLWVFGKILGIVGIVAGLIQDIIGVIGLIFGADSFKNGSATINAVKSVFTGAGDINSPSDGKTQISTKEGGLFELSKNDDIVAAPGASAAMARATQPQQVQQQVVMQNNNQESKKTNQLLEQILSKQGIVKMDSTDVGTAFAMNTYQVQ